MARTPYDGQSGQTDSYSDSQTTHLSANGEEIIQVPGDQFIADAEITREGQDLVLESPDGSVVVIEGYFLASPAPVIESPSGGVLTQELVDSFMQGKGLYASNATITDESPVGAVEEISGEATVIRVDGTEEPLTLGTPIYQGDVIETAADGAVNIVFLDETSMAVSENARLAVDEYMFDPETESGTTNFSVLRGVFVFTSGLIGRDDPDDVEIDTPVGSIGIRGTIIAGKIDPAGESEITVVEGAIVVRNGLEERTLSQQFESIKLSGFNDGMEELGVKSANDVNTSYGSVKPVAPTLFSAIDDTAQEEAVEQGASQENSQSEGETSQEGSESPDSQAEESQETQSEETSGGTQDAGASAEETSDNTQQDDTAGANETTEGTQDAASQSDGTDDNPQNETTPADGTTDGTTDDDLQTPDMTLDTGFEDSNTMSGSDGSSDGSTQTSAGSTSGSSGTSNGSSSGSSGSSTTQNDDGSDSSSGDDGTTDTNLIQFNLVFSGLTIPINAQAGDQIGSVSTTLNLTGVQYQKASTNPNFSVGPNGKIFLTDEGQSALENSLGLGPLKVKATFNSTSVTKDVPYSISSPNADPLNLNDSSEAGVSIISDDIGNGIGNSVTALGDINDDGYADFAFTNSVDGDHHSYIVSGGASGAYSGPVNGGVGTISSLIGLTGASELGVLTNNPDEGGNVSNTTMSGIGDFDGDGFEDYVIGMPNDNDDFGPTPNSGSAFIISGNDGSFIELDDQQNDSETGYSVTGLGDINNDGYADVLISAPADGAGKSYLIYGDTGSFGTHLDVGVDVTSIDGAAAGDRFGESVSGIGDFDGDGTQDFIIGAPEAGLGNKGAAYIYSGSNPGGPPLSTIEGNTGQKLGNFVEGLGDFNGDGYSDVLIATEQGKAAHILMGGNGIDATINTNLSGDLTGTNVNSVSLKLSAGSNFTIEGGGAVGDFNGDGFDDVGIVLGNSLAPNKASIYIVYGNDSLQSLTLADLQNPQTAFAMKYEGVNVTSGDLLEISAIGDVNGDGFDDVGIGAPSADGDNGEVIVIDGREGGGDRAIVNGSGGINATANNQSLIGSNGTDAFEQNSHINLSYRGGAGDDLFRINDTSFVSIDGGTGDNDTIAFDGGGNLDFGNINFEQISGIEQIGFTQDGSTIRLTKENLFNLLQSSDTGELKIEISGTGEVNNLIIDDPIADPTDDPAGLQSTLGSQTPSNDGTYNIFEIGGYDLYINQNITLDVQ